MIVEGDTCRCKNNENLNSVARAHMSNMTFLTTRSVVQHDCFSCYCWCSLEIFNSEIMIVHFATQQRTLKAQKTASLANTQTQRYTNPRRFRGLYHDIKIILPFTVLNFYQTALLLLSSRKSLVYRTNIILCHHVVLVSASLFLLDFFNVSNK